MRRLLPAILLSVALHLLLIMALGFRNSPDNDDASVRSSWRRLDSTLVMVGRASAQVPSPGDGASQRQPSPRHVPAATAPDPVIPLLPRVSGEGGDDAYRSAADLDLHPEPLAPIMVPPPVLLELDGQKGAVVLVLYVDVLGRVERVDVESSNVPEEVAEVAAATFRSAQMRPGEINGVPVPVKMKILVEYKSF